MPTVPTRPSTALDEAALAEARARVWRRAGGQAAGLGLGRRHATGSGRTTPFPTDARGRRMLVQPFLPAIATEGEYSLMLFDGDFSHAIVKRPKARRLSRPAASRRAPSAVRAAAGRDRAGPGRAGRRARRGRLCPGRHGRATTTGELRDHGTGADRAGAVARSMRPTAARHSPQPFAQRRARAETATGGSPRSGWAAARRPSRAASISRDQRVERHARVARRRLQRRPEHRLEADRGLVPGDSHRALDAAARSRRAINTCAGRR